MLFNAAPITALVVGIGGAVALALLVVGVLSAWPARHYGRVVTEVILAAFVFYILLAPTAFTGKLATFAGQILS